MTSFASLSIAIIMVSGFVVFAVIATPLTTYALSHDEICKKTTLYPLTLPPEKPEHVTLCHPIGKALAAANNANIQFNLGVVDAQKNINQTKCPTGHTENYCDGWDYQMRWR